MALSCLFQPTMCASEGPGPAVWRSGQRWGSRTEGHRDHWGKREGEGEEKKNMRKVKTGKRIRQ